MNKKKLPAKAARCKEPAEWWKNAVGYQIYPRSFYDSNHDGIGDLNGIRAKLPYIADLGVDFIWINPIYASPNKDNGYDISDYQAIHPDFGTMADFQALVAEAHTLQLKIIMDLVINHTSDQHPWFQEARKAKDNPYRDYYHWQDAKADKLPNDWQSFFGGSTWTYDAHTEQAYFHVFAPEQPDLNWTNHKVRQEIYAMIRWWLDRGIDGFRIDAISHIQKESWDFPLKTNPWEPFMNVAGIETYLTELKEVFAEYPIMTVGEASGVAHDQASAWTGDTGYFNMIFELEHCKRIGEPGHEKGSIAHLKKCLNRWQLSLANNGWNALYLENHDTPRSVSVYGDGTSQAAKALATVLLLLKGTPFIYQGQEIGMTNYPFHTIAEINAADTKYFYQSLLSQSMAPEKALAIATNWSRDHSRTPFQWDNSPNGGFSDHTPWLPVNPNFEQINVEQQLQDPDSVFRYYQKLIQLKKRTPALVTGSFHLLLPDHPTIFCYTRTTETDSWLIFVQLAKVNTTIQFPASIIRQEWQPVLTNTTKRPLQKCMVLQPFEAHVYRKIGTNETKNGK